MKITPRMRPALSMPSVYAKGHDTVPAMLSPGEFVLSREDLQHPAVQLLVQHLTKTRGARGGGPGPVQHFAAGGAVDDSYSPWMAALGRGGSMGNLGAAYEATAGNTGLPLSGQAGYTGRADTGANLMSDVTNQRGEGAYNPLGDPQVMRMLGEQGYNDVYQQNSGMVNQLQSLGMDDPMARAGMLAAGRRAGMQGLATGLTNARAGAAQSAQDFIRQALGSRYGQEETDTRQTQSLNQQANEFNASLDWQKQQWAQARADAAKARKASTWGQIGNAIVGGGIGFLTGGPAGAGIGALKGYTGKNG